MKLVCINRDGCGFYATLSKMEDDDISLENPTCPDCGEIAVLFNKNYIPSFYSHEDSIDEIIASIHNLYTEELNKKNNQ